jgi:threonine-phosphate decarboxylase
VARSEIIQQLRSYLEPWSLNAVAERVALACLTEADQFTRRTREWLRSERRYLVDQLSAIACLRVFRSAANFLMLQVDDTPAAQMFGEFMLTKGIAVRDLRTMSGCEAGFYRVAVLGREDNDRLIAAARAYASEA